MDPVSWEQRLALIDDLVKKGKKAEVLTQISDLVEKNLPLEMKPKIARLANRSGHAQLALKILFRSVRDENSGSPKTTSEAKSVYAQSLLNIGALHEADVLLSSISDLPEIALQKAFVCFAKWDYQSAIPHLKRYMEIRQLSRYQKFVGQVNYIAALVSVGEFKKALVLVDKIESSLIQDKAHLLLGNINELKAQIFIFLKDYQRALQAIDQSSEYLQAFPGRYSLYTRKWTAVIKFHTDKNSLQLYSELKQICKEAYAIQDWETVRDCEFHIAVLLDRKNTMDQIYLGSPYAGFRKRLRDLYSLKAPKSKSQKYFIGDFNLDSAKTFIDLTKGQQTFMFSAAELRFLQVLLKDLFRPPRIGEIFAGLFPKEYFDPFSSPQRIKNVMHRLNKNLLKMQSNVQVKIIKGYFRFNSPDSLVIRFNHSQLFWQNEKFILNFLHQIVGGKSFTYEDVKLKFDNALLFKKVVNWGFENGKIAKISRTKPNRYKFVKSNLKLKPVECL